jgi:hypothetical protein
MLIAFGGLRGTGKTTVARGSPALMGCLVGLRQDQGTIA